MLSATWPSSVRRLAADFGGEDIVLASVGVADIDHNRTSLNALNLTIKQVVMICREEEKMRLLEETVKDIVRMVPLAKTLVFCRTKDVVEHSMSTLRRALPRSHLLVSLHGGKRQESRTEVLSEFRLRKNGALMIATDIAARGLDVPDIQFIINYDFPNTIEGYVHRIGRTGRLQGVHADGVTYTFFTWRDKRLAADMIDLLHKCSQCIPTELRRMAHAYSGSEKRRSRRENDSRRRKRSRSPLYRERGPHN
ncbi:hypothetical protein ACOME3_003378 [Neoechinorhynchus agilis]